MIAGEGVFAGMIEGENAQHALRAFQRHGERGAERGKLRRVIQITRLDRRIAIQNGLDVFGHPAAQPLPIWYFERGEQARVLAGHILRHQLAAMEKVDGEGVKRDQPLQTRGEHG